MTVTQLREILAAQPGGWKVDVRVPDSLFSRGDDFDVADVVPTGHPDGSRGWVTLLLEDGND